MVRIEKLTASLGARVTGVDARAGISDHHADLLRDALREHLVLFLPEQHLDDDGHRALGECFGPPAVHPVAAHVGLTDPLALVHNDAASPPSDDTNFHTDYSFHRWIPAAAVLCAQVVPSRGGDTVWANMHDVWDTLSAPLRSWLEGLSAYHSMGPIFPKVMEQRFGAEVAQQIVDAFPGTVHPLVVRHPDTDRPALFVNAGYTQHVVGLHATESDALLQLLFRHVHQPRFHCRYHWSAGDVAIWDEVATLHQGPDDFRPETRTLRRITAGRIAPGEGRRLGPDES